MIYILFKAYFSADPAASLEDREFLPLVKAAKRFVRCHFGDRKCTFTITAHTMDSDKEMDTSIKDTEYQKVCKFAYYPNGYFQFPGYERFKFMLFPDCYEE